MYLYSDGNALPEWKVKVQSFLGKAYNEDSEHYKEFVKNNSTRMYGTYLNTLKRLRAIFLATKGNYEDGYRKSTRHFLSKVIVYRSSGIGDFKY